MAIKVSSSTGVCMILIRRADCSTIWVDLFVDVFGLSQNWIPSGCINWLMSQGRGRSILASKWIGFEWVRNFHIGSFARKLGGSLIWIDVFPLFSPFPGEEIFPKYVIRDFMQISNYQFRLGGCRFDSNLTVGESRFFRFSRGKDFWEFWILNLILGRGDVVRIGIVCFLRFGLIVWIEALFMFAQWGDASTHR